LRFFRWTRALEEPSHFLSDVNSSFSSVFTTNTASSLAGSVLLAFSSSVCRSPGISGEVLPGAINNGRPIIDRSSDRSFENRRVDKSRLGMQVARRRNAKALLLRHRKHRRKTSLYLADDRIAECKFQNIPGPLAKDHKAARNASRYSI